MTGRTNLFQFVAILAILVVTGAASRRLIVDWQLSPWFAVSFASTVIGTMCWLSWLYQYRAGQERGG
jgi:hypothetical protein